MHIRRMVALGGSLAALMTLGSAVWAQAPADPAQAQGRRQGRGGRGATLTTLPVDTLDAILKLNPDQKTKITAIREKYTTDARALRQPGQPPDPKLAEVTAQANKDIEAVLTDDQKAAWKGAQQDLRLFAAAGIPAALYKEIKLTDDQKGKLGDLVKEYQGKLQGVQGADRRAIVTEEREKTGALLTADQKALIEKYNKEHPRQGGRRQQPPPA